MAHVCHAGGTHGACAPIGSPTEGPSGHVRISPCHPFQHTLERFVPLYGVPPKAVFAMWYSQLRMVGFFVRLMIKRWGPGWPPEAPPAPMEPKRGRETCQENPKAAPRVPREGPKTPRRDPQEPLTTAPQLARASFLDGLVGGSARSVKMWRCCLCWCQCCCHQNESLIELCSSAVPETPKSPQGQHDYDPQTCLQVGIIIYTT